MIGKRIRLARKAKGLTLREIGEIMGVTPQAVALWEKTNPKFEFDKSLQIAKILDVEIKWLNGRVGDDSDIIKPNYRSIEGNKVPLVSTNQSIYFAMRNDDVYPNIKNSVSENTKDVFYETTSPIIGDAFAVRAYSDINELWIRKDDILIFDTGLEVEMNDVVIALIIIEKQFICAVSQYVGERFNVYPEDRNIANTIELFYHGLEEPHRMEMVRPYAVLVEVRRIRHGKPRE